MYCVGVRLWPCKRSLVARALSLPTPALQVNTPPYSPSARQKTSSFRSPSVTLEQLQLLLLLPVQSRRPFCTTPPADPSLRGANREVDSGNTKEGRATSTGTAQAGSTCSAGDDAAEERSSSAAEIDGENGNTAASSSPPLAFLEKPPHETFHPGDVAPGEQQPQPRTPQPDDKTKRPPKKSAHAVAMEEFAALERKLASRSVAPPPTASRLSRAEEVTNTNSSNTSNGNGNGNSSSSNGSKEKRKTAEQVAMEEFAALERKLLGSAGGGGGGGDSQGPKERVVSSSRKPRSPAAAAARPKVRFGCRISRPRRQARSVLALPTEWWEGLGGPLLHDMAKYW